MPTLLDGFSNRLAFILTDYVETPTRLQAFLQNPFKRMLAYLFFSKQVTTELDLNQAKHTIAGNFSVLYLPHIGEQTLKLRAADQRNTPTIKALDFASGFSAVTDGKEDELIIWIDPRLLDTEETRSRNLDVLAKELTARLAMLEEARAGHKVGQLEGILAANLAAVNVMINFYNKIAIHLIEDIDSIDQGSDYYARLIRFAAEYLRDLAYDRALFRYSEQHKIKISPEHYLGSGAEKLPLHVQDNKMRVLFNSLVYSSLAYSQMRIVFLIRNNPEVVLSDKHARILTDARPGIVDGTDITNSLTRCVQELYINLDAFEKLIRKEIGSVPNKNDSNIARLNTFDTEYPRLPLPAKIEAEVMLYEPSVPSTNDESLPPPPVSHHADHEKRQMDYINVSDCGSECGRPEELERAKSVFTPQLTPLWRDITKAKNMLFTPPCGVLYAKHTYKNGIVPAPVVHANRMVVG